MSCRTNASRSAGDSCSRTTSSASPTESASSASCSGSPPSMRSTTGSGRRSSSSGSSRRALRARNMFRQTRATTVVSQPPRFSISLGVAAAEAHPGLLHRVVGLAERAEHPVGDRAQVSAVLLELPGQELVVVHRSHLLALVGHRLDPPTTAGVTGEEAPSMDTMIPEARLTHPAFLLPGALETLQSLNKVVQRAGVPAMTAELIALRAGQINGCGVCVVQHPKIMRKLGETDDRIFAVAAWREAPFFTEAERAALALTEAVTRLADRADPSPTRSGTRPPATTTRRRSPALLLAIANINVWNRLNVATRQVAGQAVVRARPRPGAQRPLQNADPAASRDQLADYSGTSRHGAASHRQRPWQMTSPIKQPLCTSSNLLIEGTAPGPAAGLAVVAFRTYISCSSPAPACRSTESSSCSGLKATLVPGQAALGERRSGPPCRPFQPLTRRGPSRGYVHTDPVPRRGTWTPSGTTPRSARTAHHVLGRPRPRGSNCCRRTAARPDRARMSRPWQEFSPRFRRISARRNKGGERTPTSPPPLHRPWRSQMSGGTPPRLLGPRFDVAAGPRARRSGRGSVTAGTGLNAVGWRLRRATRPGKAAAIAFPAPSP